MSELDVVNITCTKEEARKIVKKSNILILPGLTLKELFLVDQVRKQEHTTFVSKFGSLHKVEGTWYDPKIETLATWVTFKGNKPKFFDISKGEEGMALIQTMENIDPELTTARLTHESMLNQA